MIKSIFKNDTELHQKKIQDLEREVELLRKDNKEKDRQIRAATLRHESLMFLMKGLEKENVDLKYALEIFKKNR